MWGLHDREDYRLFKLNRIVELKALMNALRSGMFLHDMSPRRHFRCDFASQRSEADMKWRLIERRAAGELL